MIRTKSNVAAGAMKGEGFWKAISSRSTTRRSAPEDAQDRTIAADIGQQRVTGIKAYMRVNAMSEKVRFSCRNNAASQEWIDNDASISLTQFRVAKA